MPSMIQRLKQHGLSEAEARQLLTVSNNRRAKPRLSHRVLLKGLTLPTPFGGSISLPDLETPPLRLPARPDARVRKAIAHGLGQDASGILSLVPWVGDLIGTAIGDMHGAEINKVLDESERSLYLNYNKVLPSAVALARTLLFKEV